MKLGKGRRKDAAGEARSDAGEERSFETCLGRLEEIVAELEGSELPLERAIALFEEGVGLGRQCTSRLDAAERRITVLLETADGALEEEDFDPAAASPEATGQPARTRSRGAPSPSPAARATPRASAARPAPAAAPEDDDDLPF